MSKLGIFTATLLAAAVFTITACNEEKENTTVSKGIDNVVMKLAFNQPENNPEYKILEKFSDILNSKTKGSYTIDIFPNALLGDQKDTIEMVQNGTLQFSVVAGSLLENWNSDFAVFNLPYIFQDYKHLQRTLKDPYVVNNLFKSLESHGITVVCAMYSGSRNLYTKEGVEVRVPEDLKDLKIRVMHSGNMIEALKYLGAIPVPLDQSDIYSSMQAGVIDGGEDNEVSYYILDQHEVAPTYNMTAHMTMPDYVITNTKFYNSLPDNVKKVFKEDLYPLVNEEFALFEKASLSSLEQLKKEGVVIVESDKEAFKKALEPIIQKNLTTESTKKLYAIVEKYRDVVQEHQKEEANLASDKNDDKKTITNTNVLQETAKNVKEAVSDAAKDVSDKIESTAQKAQDLKDKVVDATKETVSDVSDKVGTEVEKALDTTKEIKDKVVESVVDKDSKDTSK